MQITLPEISFCIVKLFVTYLNIREFYMQVLERNKLHFEDREWISMFLSLLVVQT